MDKKLWNKIFRKNTLTEKKDYWLGPVGKVDDFGDKISDELIDAATQQGPWALMTPKSWKTHGKGQLGLGKGQRFKKQKDNPEDLKWGTWLKVEG